MPANPLQTELLELGLEDDIPLGEAVNDPDVQRAAGGDGDTPEVRAALTSALRALLDRNLIVVSKGRATGEPIPLPPDAAAELLESPDWFEWGQEENEERVFFVNVEVIPLEDRPAWLR